MAFRRNEEHDDDDDVIKEEKKSKPGCNLFDLNEYILEYIAFTDFFTDAIITY